jgi:hypothetical protein
MNGGAEYAAHVGARDGSPMHADAAAKEINAPQAF